MTRPRRWIEDKLWSTFGPEQASANLRQALSKIRTALGPYSEVLISDRSSIGLDQTRVRVDLIEDTYGAEDRAELLQGLDVRDPEFEDWLRQERTEFETRLAAAQPSPAKGILIACRSDADVPGRAKMLGDILANKVGENISEQIRAWRQAEDLSDLPSDAPQSDVLVHTQMVEDGDGQSVFIKAIHQPSARILFSKLQRFERTEDILETSGDVPKLVFEAADQIIGKLPQVLDSNRPESRATALSRLGMYRMFSLEKDALREANSLMSQAFQHDDNGLYLAWSSLIRLIQLMEMAETDREGLKDEAIDLQYRALEKGADNSLVQAIVSRVRRTAMGDTEGGLIMAQNAVDYNPANAYAWVSLAEANMRMGNFDAALEMSARARFIARTSPFKHWWDTGHCVIAIACNRPQEATEAGEAAARAAPLSRPAHRHLLALYASNGDFEKAQATADRLTKIEPGFTLDRLVNDESYPVRTLRNNGLLEPIKALL